MKSEYLIFIVVGITIFYCYNKTITENFKSFSTGVIDYTPIKWFKSPKTHIITIENHEFSPQFLSIMKNDSVKWVNKDKQPHNITSHTGFFTSSTINTGESYTQKLNATGVYNYNCQLHPYTKGSITVVMAGNRHTSLGSHDNYGI